MSSMAKASYFVDILPRIGYLFGKDIGLPVDRESQGTFMSSQKNLNLHITATDKKDTFKAAFKDDSGIALIRSERQENSI